MQRDPRLAEPMGPAIKIKIRGRLHH